MHSVYALIYALIQLIYMHCTHRHTHRHTHTHTDNIVTHGSVHLSRPVESYLPVNTMS